MRKIIAVLILCLPGVSVFGETVVAELEGMKVYIVEYQLNTQGSGTMGRSGVGTVLTLEPGGTPQLPSLEVNDPDQEANELSVTVNADSVEIKAWAQIGTTYHFTTSSGIGTSASSNSGDWSGYDYMSVEYPDSHEVLQNYFPDPVFIGDGDTISITAVTHFPYNAYFWDGQGEQESPFDWMNVSSGPAFAVANMDIVLAINKTLDIESYYFGLSASVVTDPVNHEDAFVGTLFLDQIGNIYIGVVKFATGTDTGWTWARIEGVAPNGSNEYAFGIAEDYSENLGNYDFNMSTTGFTRAGAVGGTGSFSVTHPTNGTTTFYYRRFE